MTNILPGTLQDIIIKARNLAAANNNDQYPDTTIIKYLNSFYLYDVPQDLRVLKLKDMYVFNTIQGIDTYPFNYINWSTVQPPAYSAKQQMAFYQDPAMFFGNSYNLQQIIQLTTGDGGMGPYAGTVAGPMLRSYYNNPMQDTQLCLTTPFPGTYPPVFDVNNISRIQNILITANTADSTLNVTDDGNGNLIGDCSAGTINYQTGAIAGLTFTGNIPSGNTIYIEYKQTSNSQPFSILFWQNQFIVSPVPDKGYTIEMVGYRTPSQVLLGTSNPSEVNLNGVPEDYEWWELLAFGVAKKLFQDRLDLQGAELMQKWIDEKVSDARTNTYGQLSKQRVPTIFQNQTNRLNEYGYGFGYGLGLSSNN